MSLQKSHLVVNPQNGKISLAKSVPSCPRCHSRVLHIRQLQQRIRLLEEQSVQHKHQQEQLDSLCQEIAKAKARLAEKLKEKQAEGDKQDSRTGLALRPMTAVGSEASKELSTNRTWRCSGRE